MAVVYPYTACIVNARRYQMQNLFWVLLSGIRYYVYSVQQCESEKSRRYSMKKEDYINWETIDQKEYKAKILTYIEKLDDQQKELFEKILECIQNAGGVEENVLCILLEEAASGEYNERRLSLLSEYLSKSAKLEDLNSELEFYKKRLQGVEEKNKSLRKEIMDLKAKKRGLNSKLEQYQEQFSQAEEENKKNFKQMKLLLQMQESLGRLMADNKELKEGVKNFNFVHMPIEKKTETGKVKVEKGTKKPEAGEVKTEKAEAEKPEIEKVKAETEIKKNETREVKAERAEARKTEIDKTETEKMKTEKNEKENTQGEIEAEDKKKETKESEKENPEKEKNRAEIKETKEEIKETETEMEETKSSDEEVQESPIENVTDLEEYETLMDVVSYENMYYPLEEYEETEKEIGDSKKNKRGNFFNHFLGQTDWKR